MRTRLVVGALFVACFREWVEACAGHAHGQETHWSQEKLDDLERKWGFEVRPVQPVESEGPSPFGQGLRRHRAVLWTIMLMMTICV